MSQFGQARFIGRVSVFAALTALALGSTGARAETGETAGTIVTTKGIVLLRDPDAKGAPAKLKPGDTVSAGQIINTASDASAKLLLKDKSIIDIGPSTLFNVEHFKGDTENRQATLNMEYGSVRAVVSKKINSGSHFRIRTRTATMGVRGTEFVVMSDLIGMNIPSAPKGAPGGGEAPPADKAGPAQMKVVVLEGKVEVDSNTAAPAGESKETVTLTENQKYTETVKDDGTETAPTEETDAAPPPKVEAVTVEEKQEVEATAKVADNTFKKEIVIDTKAEGAGSGGATMGAISEMLAGNSFEPPKFEPPVAGPGCFGSCFAGVVGQNVQLSVKFNKGSVGPPP